MLFVQLLEPVYKQQILQLLHERSETNLFTKSLYLMLLNHNRTWKRCHCL